MACACARDIPVRTPRTRAVLQTAAMMGAGHEGSINRLEPQVR